MILVMIQKRCLKKKNLLYLEIICGDFSDTWFKTDILKNCLFHVIFVIIL